MRKALIALAGLALAAAPLTAAHAVTSFDVSAKVPSQTARGNTIAITGHVDGVTTKGYTVDVHAHYDAGKGSTLSTIHVGHADVHSSGNYSKSYTPPKGGAYSFNVDVYDKYGHHVGSGETLQLLVLRWTALQNLNMVQDNESAPEGYAGKTTGKTVAGVKWTHELFLRDNAILYFAWNLPCTQFRSYVGISDSAPSGTTATTTGGQLDTIPPLIDVNLTRGIKRHITRDLVVDGPYFFRLDAEFAAGTDTVTKKVIYGEPQAYCAIG
jgi:hypothetical protein